MELIETILGFMSNNLIEGVSKNGEPVNINNSFILISNILVIAFQSLYIIDDIKLKKFSIATLLIRIGIIAAIMAFNPLSICVFIIWSLMDFDDNEAMIIRVFKPKPKPKPKPKKIYLKEDVAISKDVYKYKKSLETED